MNRYQPLTTLEEDLRDLGLLLNEEGPETRAPKGEPASNGASSARNVGAMTDKPTNKGETGTDEMPGEPHKGKVAKTIPAAKEPVKMTGGDAQEGIEGEPDKRRGTDSDDDDDDADDDDDKKSKIAKDESYVSASSAAIESIARSKSRMENKSYDHVSKLLSDANSILESIDETRRSESVKAFANVSIMAEMLRRGIGSYAERTSDGELAETAETFGLLSTEAQSFAESIEAGEDLDEAALAEQFQNQIGALLSGLDFYSTILEELQGEPVAESEDDGDDNEDDGEDDVGADDDGEDDDKDDKKKKKSDKEESRLPYGVKKK